MLSRLSAVGGQALRASLRPRGSAPDASSVSGVARACMSTASTFALPPLPYEYDALEPHIDAMTMQIHHKRHHQTYISNLNSLIGGAAKEHLAGMPLDSIQKACSSLPKEVKTPVVNSGGGHYNHTLWWSTLRPDSNGVPPGELRAKIDADFPDFEAMKKEFEDAAAKRFGSGWAWLSVNADGKLFISSTANQENPLMEGLVDEAGTPIMGLDVWEHAYYLKYQNRRPEYIKAFWDVVDWERVAENYESARSGGTAVFDVPMES